MNVMAKGMMSRPPKLQAPISESLTECLQGYGFLGS
jgi:hypothetical protein